MSDEPLARSEFNSPRASGRALVSSPVMAKNKYPGQWLHLVAKSLTKSPMQWLHLVAVSQTR